MVLGYAEAHPLIAAPKEVCLSIFVHPRCRASGVGTSLLLAVIAWARSFPRYERLVLFVRPDNVDAQRLYSRHGFVVATEARDAIKMELVLDRAQGGFQAGAAIE
jgi:ribosomal protein S18 acetylase RimI-like enzyme